MSESCIDDETSECKCVNGPTKDDIALHKKKLWPKHFIDHFNKQL